MGNEKDSRKLTYEKATATIDQFDNSDVITTSGGGCVTWSNQNGVACHYGLTES